jgi:hypothetical protein
MPRFGRWSPERLSSAARCQAQGPWLGQKVTTDQQSSRGRWNSLTGEQNCLRRHPIFLHNHRCAVGP